jgi:tetratricopeptide (TPR) repeat protein/CHAT domain-containing protein
MAPTINLIFPDPAHVIVNLGSGFTQPLAFVNPLTQKDLETIRWYLETYTASYTTDVDDQQARAIEQNFPVWGQALFAATLGQFVAQAAFTNFYNQKQPGRLLTIGASHPDILALPWELLHIPGGNYLFHSNPRISIRRQFNVSGGFNLTEFQPKATVRLLFIISRPSNAGFINPRSDAQAVLAALEAEAPGRVEVEFLRPATLDALSDRLDDRRKPAIDIIHFDGHGVYDPDGRWSEEARSSHGVELTRSTAAEATGMGYLLFEDAQGQRAPISAEKLAATLNEQTVGLIVLSACQSAKVATPDKVNEDDPTEGVMGSVAARLTHAGIPAVLAMTHSVLVTATEALFGQFYQNLGRSQGIGEALDNARRHLYRNTARGRRLRGQQEVFTLHLQDWFLPALYQAGADTALLTDVPAGLSIDGWDTRQIERVCAPDGDRGNLPKLQEAGFWGRSYELWQIEQAFVQGTRRLSITGFGGQGKTYLAVEAGRWLYQTGMFERVCFVDYAAYQGQDPVSYAVSTLATVLNTSLIDADAATAHLGQTPTLMILDNLEALEPDPQRQLLDVAKAWSEAGHSRMLLTTRQPDFHHPDYKPEGSHQHIALPLRGLGSEAYPQDALDYFKALWALPPAPTTPVPDRAALVKLFALVDFHPLSIGLLGRQLKDRRIAEVGQRLAELLTENDNPLVASLKLSLDRLDDQSRQWVPKLGVFQGGALESQLLQVLEVTEAEWQPIRAQLEHAGLMQAEYLPNITPLYLKFHPTLAPVLWAQLPAAAQSDLQTRHRQCYYQLSGSLYQQDDKNPHEARDIARRELPNLIQAVNLAISAVDPNSVTFGINVSFFLEKSGLIQDRAILSHKLRDLQGDIGSRTWYLAHSNQGEMLYSAGSYSEALKTFTGILEGLEVNLSYERCLTLNRIGRCLVPQGQADKAVQFYREGIIVAKQLEQNDLVKRQQGALFNDLGNALRILGDYTGSNESYKEALKISEALGDLGATAATQGQLGTLALVQRDLPEAVIHYQSSLSIFQELEEPAGEARSLHQLGRVYEVWRKWDEAEKYYRNSLCLKEAQGNIAGAARTYNQLALVSQNAGRIESAISWYEKAANAFRELKDARSQFKVLNNLASLLQSQPNPTVTILSTARHYAEAALAIMQTLDPSAAEIWKVLTTLAEIAEQQGQADQARAYRQQARQAKAAFVGTQYELRRHGQLITAVIMAALQPDQKAQLDPILQQYDSSDWPSLVAAICLILNGERDEDSLVDPLGPDESMIVSAILRGIADPTTLSALLGEE